mmetsp:Transcript_17673/g.26156  ORF Transcript_17673/g.26156 Transcript_17673/m.26156 type:complete len:272 (-) Transcript_17673:38-853(-)
MLVINKTTSSSVILIVYLTTNLLQLSAGFAGFTPTASPRFDTFCDSIVASWHVPPSGEVESVDEVVRSCGGAIQGIRELPLIGKFYLNRADDGFVFYDCGTYSHGPVILNSAASFKLMTSISMTNNFRVILIADIDSSLQLTSSKALCLPKATFRSQQNDDVIGFSGPDVMSSAPDYIVQNSIQCRMSLPNQPWMLQRSQWESHKETYISIEKKSSSDPQVPYQSWVETIDGGLSISVGSVCTSSGQVKEIIRTFSNGKLINVLKKEGNLI